jgi:predicted HTH domain antitoxin
MTVLEIEQAIKQLPPDELAELANWFAEFHASAWDKQIEADVDSRRLDKVLKEVSEEYDAGLARPLSVIELPEYLLQSARTTPEELKVEIAIQLYQQRRLSIGHARELADMSLWEFRQLLASRRIAPQYDVEDLNEDMETWNKLDHR